MKKIKHLKLYILGIILITIISNGFYHYYKDSPSGINYTSLIYQIDADKVNFLYDLTYSDLNNKKIYQQEIFDEIFQAIKTAEKYILIDMFLFNSYKGESMENYRELSLELKNKLITQKKNYPDIKIDFITDQINNAYSTSLSPELTELKSHNINIIISNLKPLRDSNIMYSAIWRTLFASLGTSRAEFFPNPFSSSASRISLRSYFKLINFKANHRKVFIADQKDSFVNIISSANPHGGSASHSNTALKIISSDLAQEIYQSEKIIAGMSQKNLSNSPKFKKNLNNNSEKINTQLITELAIKESLLNEIKDTGIDDKIKMAMFYLADRDIINALIKASQRNVIIQIILDPNKDAFGYKKNGIPNRPVAQELSQKSNKQIQIRWYNTQGEQFHSKITIFQRKNSTTAILGSANLTRRNINNYNLETDLKIEGDNNLNTIQKINNYFNTIWENKKGNHYVNNYATYKNTSRWKTILYRFQEFTGLSTF